MTRLALIINGRPHGPMEVRDELTMNDFLREVLGLTGTKFGCGAAQCLSCAVIVDGPGGKSFTSPTCIVPAVSFNGKTIRTVEGHAKDGELTALQQAFISHFAFQCGYCTAGFLKSPGAARAPGAPAGAAPRSRGDDRRGARWASLSLHRLHPVPRGGARGSSRIPPVTSPNESPRHAETCPAGCARLWHCPAARRPRLPPMRPRNRRGAGLRPPPSFATIADEGQRSQAISPSSARFSPIRAA